MAEIKVLSAGAVKTGLAKLAQAFEDETGHKVIITFAMAPVIRSRIDNEAAGADVVFAPQYQRCRTTAW